LTLADDAVHHLDRLGAVILDDVGDGPRPADLAAAAAAARDAVAKLAVPALTQLTTLVAGVADALAGGTAEWNPSLGGTLMAAVDDLRHLASRASQFSDEDSEHLHHRATELARYGGSGNGYGDATGRTTPAAGEESPAPVSADVAAPALTPTPTPTPTVVPIDTLFYSDGGPHIVRGGVSDDAASRSDLLGRGIDALDVLVARPIARPVAFGAMEVVPVETLLYRGRAALERAAALREQIKASGGVASPAALDEMYDLIGLALKD
jgi:hypothetical protein